jgi:hypothetical protein
MIKHIAKQNILTTPFVSAKQWSLSNLLNDDLVLTENLTTYTASIGGTYGSGPVAVDYLDYSGANPFLDRDCNIALEQQTNDDVIYREGEKKTGAFSLSDPQNPDGTYKRLVYTQIKEAFYNTRKNPIEIFGMENIDFQLSLTNRYITDQFRSFIIPQRFFGDRLKAGTINIVDNTLDDNVVIVDDSSGNLIASPNLFAKIQQVRLLGNSIFSGSADLFCPPPIVEVPSSPTSLTGSLTASISGALSGAIPPYTINLNWIDNSNNEDGFEIWRALMEYSGSPWSPFSNIASTPANITVYQDTIYSSILSASYYVEAFNGVGSSTGSNIIYVSPSASLTSSSPPSP